MFKLILTKCQLCLTAAARAWSIIKKKEQILWNFLWTHKDQITIDQDTAPAYVNFMLM